jgi:hypothetical protein
MVRLGLQPESKEVPSSSAAASFLTQLLAATSFARASVNWTHSMNSTSESSSGADFTKTFLRRSKIYSFYTFESTV